MIPQTGRAATTVSRRAAWLAALAVALGTLGLSGCSLVRAVSSVTHVVQSDRGIINTFTRTLKAGEGTTFAATYMTTGASPATTTYAVKPPADLAFHSLPSGPNGNNGAGDVEIIVNSAGSYSCDRPSAGARWQCAKLSPATAAARKAIFSFYTPYHWVNFLKGFALVAGLAGDKVSTSNMTVNGFSMSCVDFVAPGVPGTSTICTTSQGILGYVKVGSSNTRFEIKSYTASPSPSLFALPPGAKITNMQNGN